MNKTRELNIYTVSISPSEASMKKGMMKHLKISITFTISGFLTMISAHKLFFMHVESKRNKENLTGVNKYMVKFIYVTNFDH